MLYNIKSKVATNRMKMVLQFLISEERSRFVEGRHILDNVIHVHDISHSLKSKEKMDDHMAIFLEGL